MLTDFKISSIVRDEKGTKVTVSFYEGEVTTELEVNPETRKEEQITRYRRKGLIEKKVFDLPAKIEDEKIQKHLKQELAKDKKRQPIPQQDAKIL